MKKLFLLLALMGMVAVGCSKEQTNEEEGGNENDIPENIFFSLDKESVTISPDGGSVDVIVYSNYKWEISGTSDWCTPSVKGGDVNEDGQKVTFSADVAYDDREAIFWFRCADEKIKFVVSQKLKEVIIPDANNTFNIPAEGGVAVISYQTSVDCEFIIPEEAQDWISIAPATRGLVSESITLNVVENTTYSARTAVIKVVAKDNAELAVEYTINQEQNNAVLANGNTEFTIDGREQQITIEHKANVDCDVIIPDDAQSWISLATSTRGLSTYSTTLNIAENNSDIERSCVVKVTSQDDNELSAEYTITQNPRYCLYYTSNDGKIVQPYDSSAFGATIISNTYKDGVGVIEFKVPITAIGSSAFYECSSLTSVNIPDSVTTIGASAFSGCTSLKSVNIPDSVTTIGERAFDNCTSLTSVTIGDSVTEIGNYAFRSCTSLTSVNIHDSVTTIGNYAFQYCYSLTSVYCKATTPPALGSYVFDFNGSGRKIYVPAGSVNAYKSAANWSQYADAIVGYDFENGEIVEVQPNNEIWYTSSDGNVVTPYKTNVFGANITSNKYNNGKGVIIFDDNVTTIGYAAFSGCNSLISVNIPDSVTEIGSLAFHWCFSLTSVNIPDSVTSIGSEAFSACDSLKSVSIPDSVTTIGYATFSGCDSLKSVNIPDSVTTIGASAFSGCTSLTSVNIPDSVTTIGASAFSGCSSLTSVNIPDSVTSIGNYAFSNCTSLTSVYCKATTPPSLGYDAFKYWNESDYVPYGCDIYVPIGSVEAYKSATNWNVYASAIIGYDF